MHVSFNENALFLIYVKMNRYVHVSTGKLFFLFRKVDREKVSSLEAMSRRCQSHLSLGSMK